jgi:serine protease DegQ
VTAWLNGRFRSLKKLLTVSSMTTKNPTAAELSNTLSSVLDQAKQSVVRIGGGTSGVLWSGEHVLAALHAVDADEEVEVTLHDGSSSQAKWIGGDPGTDVALLALPSARASALEWREPDDLRLGELVVAAARPGKSLRAALGIVSALADDWRTPGGARLERYVETDAALGRGFSGGPLLDASGRALGMLTRGILRGANLVVPTPALRRIATSLIEHGSVRRGYLGVGAYPVRLPAPAANAAGQGAGLMLMSLEPDGPAERAGLLLGDVLLALDGEKLGRIGDLLGALSEGRIGQSVPARVLRAGQISERAVTVAARPARSAR